MNLKELKELIELIKNSEVTELELEKSGVRVRIKKERPLLGPVPAPPAEAAPAVQGAPLKESPLTQPQAPKGMVTVTAPVVGTFYRSPAPDAEPYVEVGSIVKRGQVLCVIEAMKLMNEIEAECDGKICAILVESAQPVEYGQPLFLIEPIAPTS